MSATIIIIIVVVIVLVTIIVFCLSLIRQKKAIMDEVNRLSLRLTEMEMKVAPPSPTSPASSTLPAIEGEAFDSKESAHTLNSETPDLSAMTDEELFHYLSKTIRDEEMFLWPNLNRNAVMERFSLSAVRIGNAFVRGGGMGLPEFVRNCRLDYACRLMVEQPEMSFTEVGNQSGYQRTTTFYHDFKARFGMPPAEYRVLELRKQTT